MNSDLKANGMEFKENLNDFMTKTEDNIQNINNTLKEHDDRMINMSDINLKMFKDAEDSRGVIEINQIMNEMITKVDNIMTLENIQKSKDTEHEIMKQLKEHNNNIK